MPREQPRHCQDPCPLLGRGAGPCGSQLIHLLRVVTGGDAVWLWRRPNTRGSAELGSAAGGTWPAAVPEPAVTSCGTCSPTPLPLQLGADLPGPFSSLGPGPGRAFGKMFSPLGCRRGFPREVGGFVTFLLPRSWGCQCGWEWRSFAGQRWVPAAPSLGMLRSQESITVVWGRIGNHLRPWPGEEGGQAPGSPSLLHPASARVKVRVSSCFHLPVPSPQPGPWQAGPPPPRAHGPHDVWDELPWEHQHRRGRGGWRPVRGQGPGRGAAQRGETVLLGFTYTSGVAKARGSAGSRRGRKS